METVIPRHRLLWAKSAKEGSGHSLLGHLLDVGAAAEFLLSDERHYELLRELASQLGLSVGELIQLYKILAALHDLGKATPAFQQKWPPGAPPEALQRQFTDVFHGEASAVILCAMLRARGWKGKLANVLAHAAGVHHGRLFPAGYSREDRYDPRSIALESAPWRQWQEALFEDVLEAFGPLPDLSGYKGTPDARSWAWLAGLIPVADWIGSSLPHRPAVADIAVYTNSRRIEVAERFADIGWPESNKWWKEPVNPKLIASWFLESKPGEPFKPRTLQKAAQKVVARERDGPTLTIIEAPMGEGKTETAFYMLVQAATSRGAYIALPTQATSDALHKRLESFVGAHKARSVDIALAHSGARLNAQVVQNHRPAESDPDAKDVEAVAESWFSAGRRELLAELGVGTIDQALLAGLPVRHHPVLLWALAGKIVVLDEIHAYDTYTGVLIRDLVRWLAALKSDVVLMSATLPSSRRQQLATAFREGLGLDAVELEEKPYPRLTVVSGHGAGVEAFDTEPERHRDVAIRPAPYGVAELGDLVRDLAGKGGAVGAIVNTVTRAQQLYLWCREHDIDAKLIHGAFPLNQRKVRERDLLDKYGPETSEVRNGIVIATQVMEQSLDVDFDVMVTDLAPVDLVLQRMGRLHRHHRSDRGGHGAPVLYVAGMSKPGDEGPDRDALGFIYDAHIVWRSWAVLSSRESAALPYDIDAWVQLVYGSAELDALTPFAAEVLEARHRSETKAVSEGKGAEQWVTAWPFRDATEAWRSAASDEEERRPGLVRIPTRLGEPAVTAIPVTHEASSWKLVGHEQAVGGGHPGAEWVEEALRRQLRVSRQGLVQKLLEAPRPDWWERTRALKFLRPLVLDSVGASVLDQACRLDPELGLVFSGDSRGEEE